MSGYGVYERGFAGGGGVVCWWGRDEFEDVSGQ
jgi:hypothetical protein